MKAICIEVLYQCKQMRAKPQAGKTVSEKDAPTNQMCKGKNLERLLSSPLMKVRAKTIIQTAGVRLSKYTSLTVKVQNHWRPTKCERRLICLMPTPGQFWIKAQHHWRLTMCERRLICLMPIPGQFWVKVQNHWRPTMLWKKNIFNSLHTKLFPVFNREEEIPLKQNNQAKRYTYEIWFAHKEIVNWEDDSNDEDIDFDSYFRILSLEIVTFVSRHNVHMLRSAGKQPNADVRIIMRTWMWSELMPFPGPFWPLHTCTGSDHTLLPTRNRVSPVKRKYTATHVPMEHADKPGWRYKH